MAAQSYLTDLSQQYDIPALASEFENRSVEDLLTWAGQNFAGRLSFACSFGAEDMLLLDLLVKKGHGAQVFYLDTGRLHEETYALVERARRHYQINIQAYFPQAGPLANLLSLKGPVSFYASVQDRRDCCFIRKVEPLSRALRNADAWITGQRRDQSVTRLALNKVELDKDHGSILKLNPLADWSAEDVWTYIRANKVPYNELHDKGFPSIGCAPCTRAIKPGEDLRAGRWWWELPEQKECGLHVSVGARGGE